MYFSPTVSLLNTCHVWYFQLNWMFWSKYSHIYINPVFSIVISLLLGKNRWIYVCRAPWIFFENNLGSRTWPCCIRNLIVSSRDITGEQCIRKLTLISSFFMDIVRSLILEDLEEEHKTHLQFLQKHHLLLHIQYHQFCKISVNISFISRCITILKNV